MNILKFIRSFLFTKQEKEIISDCYAYLYQLENSWHDVNCNNRQFCLDISLKRKFLAELCPKAFDSDINKYIDNDIWNNVREGRYNKEFNNDIVKPMLKKWNGDGIDFSEEIDCCGMKIKF